MSHVRAQARRVALVTSPLLLAAGVSSAQPASELPPTVITPMRQSQSIDDALPATSVITRAEIDRWQAVDIVSILSRETGVQFAQAGGRGAAASLFVRGANSSQVLVLVDGVRLNAGTSGAAAVGGIALDSIDRIEIVRGNLSSLYGSSAIGGVVQIFTRRGAEEGVVLSAEAGGGRTLNGRASAGVDAGPVRLGGAIGGGTTQSFSSIDPARVVTSAFVPGANPDRDGNDYLSASLGATYRSGRGTLLSANGWINRNRTAFDSTADGAGATHLEKSQVAAGNASARTTVTEGWVTQLAAGLSRDRSTNVVSDPMSFNNGEFSSDNLTVSWTNDVDLTGAARVQVGVEYLRQDGESTSYDPSFSGQSQSFTRSVGSAWAGLSGAQGSHQFQLNLRRDQYSDVDGATSALAAYGYKIDAAWRVTAQLSNAYRAPSFNDLYFPFFGNPYLEPERSASGELGLHYVGDRTTLRLAIYRTDTRDLIVYDPATARAENIDEARVTGFELGGSWREGPWQLSANGTVSRAINDDTGERLLRRASWV
ncbi:MAG TPA: TonB-dependent receptor, partial [Burkholderiaceae bacterium]|nr:TonB-dependent receptor [Burkholderiaceae bacterium]